MLKLFRSKAEKELDALIDEMKINLQNNYKSTAHAARIRLGERCEQLHAEGALPDAAYEKYRAIYDKYTEMLRDYHH